ncbi:cytochrome P450 [Granulicella sibirica]|nr:cytochrome P450 [Granulicella sibirica]
MPSWKSDELDSPIPPASEPAYYDGALGAWVLTTHADVLAALRSPSMVMDGSKAATDEDMRTLERMREETIAALSGPQLRRWSDTMKPFVEERITLLPEREVVDLVGAYLQPMCLQLAAIVTEVDEKDAARLRELAIPVSASAAEPSDDGLREQARAVTAELQACFHAKAKTLRDSGFVALSHTLPSLLANGCYALLHYPKQWTLLHRKPELMEQGVEELMRYGGLSRYLRRQATEDMVLAGVSLRKGDRLILRIVAANHDPARFVCPNDLEVLRRGRGQLTLGAGPHACVGAGLLRMAAAVVLRPLLMRFASAEHGGSVEWMGGSGFRAPSRLPVVLHLQKQSSETSNEKTS